MGVVRKIVRLEHSGSNTPLFLKAGLPHLASLCRAGFDAKRRVYFPLPFSGHFFSQTIERLSLL